MTRNACRYNPKPPPRSLFQLISVCLPPLFVRLHVVRVDMSLSPHALCIPSCRPDGFLFFLYRFRLPSRCGHFVLQEACVYARCCLAQKNCSKAEVKRGWWIRLGARRQSLATRSFSISLHNDISNRLFDPEVPLCGSFPVIDYCWAYR